jgi:hypothetical protein
MVRADLRDRFDRWYHTEHLPDALAAFGAQEATRYWSTTDDNVHFAIYRFDDIEHLNDVMNGPILADLVAEFDRNWPDGITRTREVLDPDAGASRALTRRTGNTIRPDPLQPRRRPLRAPIHLRKGRSVR